MEAQLNEQARREVWQEYMAAIAHSLGTIMSKFGGADYPMPTYNELIHPESVQEDDRTGTEIIDNLIKRLGGEEMNAESI